MKRKRKFVICVLILTALFLSGLLFMPEIRTRLIMRIVFFIEQQSAVGNKDGIRIHLSTPKNDTLKWQNYVSLFNKDNLSYKTLGIDQDGNASVSIYYNYGGFKDGRSIIYDTNSEYNSSFYGAYVLKLKDPVADIQKLASSLVRFDYRAQILNKLGLPYDDMIYEVAVLDLQEDVALAGYDDWLLVDAKVKTHALYHKPDLFRLHYLQFGKPKYEEHTDVFPIVDLYGRLYLRYFEDKEVYFFVYVLTPSKRLLEKTDVEILSKTSIEMP